jgi:hypothetical protein
MRVLVLNADYPLFLAWLYRRSPHLANAPYAEQIAARNASLFGVANFYSTNFSTLGHVSQEIHVNNPWMQAAWAREHGIKVKSPPIVTQPHDGPRFSWLRRVAAPLEPALKPVLRKAGLIRHLNHRLQTILLAQIEEFKPDLVLSQDVFYVDARLASVITQIGRPILIGQVGVAPPLAEDWRAYDMIVSQLGSVVKFFRNRNVRSEVIPLAFEPALLDALPDAPPRTIDVSFVGSVTSSHQRRVALLEAIARHCDLKLYGTGIRGLPSSSPLHNCYEGEVWGTDMYQVLRASRVSLNAHLDPPFDDAGNMRLFEATGVGSFLLTDAARNLDHLFKPGQEVATWTSVDDCLSKIAAALKDDGFRTAVARAGQRRTLFHHTYRHRAETLLRFASTLR